MVCYSIIMGLFDSLWVSVYQIEQERIKKSHLLSEDTQLRTLSELDYKCRFYVHTQFSARDCILSTSNATKENLKQIILLHQ